MGGGLLLAIWGVALLVQLAPASLPRRDAIGIDPAVLGFAVAAALLSTILFGLAPALQAMRADVADALKSGAARTAGVRAGGVRAVLVMTEGALSLMLMAGAGLMLQTFTTLNR